MDRLMHRGHSPGRDAISAQEVEDVTLLDTGPDTFVPMGNLLITVGMLLFLGAGLYQLLLAISFFNSQWGLLGVVVMLLFPPLWFFAPFVMWAVSSEFPASYFLAWAVGWFGGGALFAVGQSMNKSESAA